MHRKAIAALLALALAPAAAHAQDASLLKPPPATLSAEARARLAELAAEGAKPQPKTMAERRAASEAVQKAIGARQLARYRVTVEESQIAGVPVRIFTPASGAKPGKPLLLNLHGGGFVADSGSLTENVPIAALTGYRVVAVLYRLSPEHQFPAAVEDALAVYRALLEQEPARRIGVYGTSAGAILGPELIARLKAERLPLPGALGVFSGSGDISEPGDSAVLLGVQGLELLARGYAGRTELADPLLSPARASLAGWPPTLCLTSSRDFLLSATATLCRKLDAAGVPAKLLMFDGLPHAFWAYVESPESDEAFAAMAHFLTGTLEGVN